jgi:hypothetical protein
MDKTTCVETNPAQPFDVLGLATRQVRGLAFSSERFNTRAIHFQCSSPSTSAVRR